ncbi:putative metalloprotease with PDZ domain [Rheinheimera pacifica]|uniref:hypothetical protein n=1 Tax=Rheinheimera pacifica TaxID=173990 RepID=UPI0021682E01|nr:hypothetical protein [Rheinheimera pacifica]MCS4308486.1 putative metalloprotease with PDZ domain [Rheinheimera pacifica]
MTKFYRLLAAMMLFWACNSYAHNPSETVTKQTVTTGAITLHYEFADAQSLAKQQEFTAVITDGIRYYQQLFTGYPRDLAGKHYTDITVRIRHGKHLSGEADPKLLLLTWSDNTMFGIHTWQTLLLHEIFHLWSAESFRYQDGREHWFNEGFSEFYAFKAATQQGYVSQRDALAIAAQPLGFYYSAKGLGKVSLREAGKSNQAKRDNYFLLYHGGWVAAMLLDHDIRHKTANEHSLDKVMRWMYQYYPRNIKLYNNADIIEAIKASTGLDYQVFFTRYIEGTETLPVVEHFDLGKALWDFEFNPEQQHHHVYLYHTLGILTD